MTISNKCITCKQFSNIQMRLLKYGCILPTINMGQGTCSRQPLIQSALVSNLSHNNISVIIKLIRFIIRCLIMRLLPTINAKSNTLVRASIVLGRRFMNREGRLQITAQWMEMGWLMDLSRWVNIHLLLSLRPPSFSNIITFPNRRWVKVSDLWWI